MVLKAMAFLRKNLVWTIPVAMVLGLLFGVLFEPGFLKALVLPLTILMIFPMMVTLNTRSVFSGCNYRLEAVTQGINFVVIPLLAYLLGKLFFDRQPLTALGLFLIALLPTSGMTISWTGFARGNVTVAIRMTVIGLLLGSLAAPIYVQLFMGEVVEVSLLNTFKQVGTVVLVPLVLGTLTRIYLLRRFGEFRFRQEIKPFFPSLSSLAVLGIIFVAMALKARSIVGDPLAVLQMVPVLLLFYAVNFVIATLAGKMLFPRGDAIALVYGSVMRNLSVALAIAMVAFGKNGADIALIIAVAYVIQVQAAAWYVRMADRVFGATPSEAVSSPA